MFRSKKNWMMVALLALPAMAQRYPPPQQQQPYPQDQGQYPPQQQGQYNPPPANFTPEQLDQMVSRIALYPDPLLAQVFAASTFPDQIQAAAQWADQHHYLTGQALAAAIQNDQLGFDPSVQALLPFPSVLQMMASDMDWTASIGNAFMSQGPLLQDAVQRMRSAAYNNGYLRSNDQIRVNNTGAWTEIAPINPGYIVVPYYDPAVVYYRPWRPGFGAGISFGYGVGIGTWFNPWGWGGNRFYWDRHEVWVGNHVWDRRYVEDRRVGGYRPGFGGGPAYRPEVGRPEMGRPEMGRPEVGRPEMGRPEMGRGPAGVYVPRGEQHVLQGRSNVERRAAETGRPAPREGHGREERGREERRH